MIEQQQNDSELIAKALGACADGLNACIDRIVELERRVARLEAERRASKAASPKAKADQAEIRRVSATQPQRRALHATDDHAMTMRVPSREEIAELRREVHIARLREMAALTAVEIHRKRPRPVSTAVRQLAREIMAEAERRLREPWRPLSPAARAIIESADRINSARR